MKLARTLRRTAALGTPVLLACTAGCSSIGYAVSAGRAGLRYSAAETVNLDASSKGKYRGPAQPVNSAIAASTDAKSIVVTGTVEDVWFFNQPQSICADLSVAWIELDPDQVVPTQPGCRVIKLHFDQYSEVNIREGSRWELHFAETGEFLDLRPVRKSDGPTE